MATSKDRITVALEPAEHRELLELARKNEVSMAWIGRQAILRLLEQHKDHEFQFPLQLGRRTGT